MNLLMIFNPRAAAGRRASLADRIEVCARQFGARPELCSTRAPGDATRLVAEADLSGCDGVVAIGGDGTLFEVLNGLYLRSAQDRPPLGLVPIGTGNAFARDLGLAPGQWREALERIIAGRIRWVDVGHVITPEEEFRFLNVIGMGFPVDAGRTARRLKGFGNAAYTLGTLWQVLRLTSYPIELEIDGQAISEDGVFVEVSNTRYTGTAFMIAPHARMDDGLLDVTLLRKLGRARLLSLFPTVYEGRHVYYDEVRTWQASHVRIVAPGGMPLAPDGEFRGKTPAEIRCLRQDLALFA